MGGCFAKLREEQKNPMLPYDYVKDYLTFEEKNLISNMIIAFLEKLPPQRQMQILTDITLNREAWITGLLEDENKKEEFRDRYPAGTSLQDLIAINEHRREEKEENLNFILECAISYPTLYSLLKEHGLLRIIAEYLSRNDD